MTIDEAIRVLSDKDPDIDGIMNDDYSKAIKLGIEALKRIKDARGRTMWVVCENLPGETE